MVFILVSVSILTVFFGAVIPTIVWGLSHWAPRIKDNKDQEIQDTLDRIKEIGYSLMMGSKWSDKFSMHNFRTTRSYYKLANKLSRALESTSSPHSIVDYNKLKPIFKGNLEKIEHTLSHKLNRLQKDRRSIIGDRFSEKIAKS